MTLYLLNTSIITNDGIFVRERITVTDAKKLIAKHKQFTSAIGHEATAVAMSTLLGVEIPVNRMTVRQKIGDVAIVLQCRRRMDEGRILALKKLEEIGFDLYLIYMLNPRLITEPYRHPLSNAMTYVSTAN